MAKAVELADALDTLLNLVNRHCAGHEIQDVLRGAKDLNKDVKISGKNKPGILENLRDALTLKAASPDDLYALVRNSEESGHQLIRLFRPLTKEVKDRCNDGENIAIALFGKNWRSRYSFPTSNVELKGEAWGDFRLDNVSAHGSSWTAKLDAGVIKKVYEKQLEEGDRITTVHRKVPAQETYLIKWHSFGLLEIRTPIGDSKESRLEGYNRVTEAIKNALEVGIEFETIDLRPALLKIRAKIDSPHGSELFSWVNFELANALHGTAWLKACSPDDNILQQKESKDLFDRYGACSRAAISWNFDRTDVVKDQKKAVLTHIGVYGINTIHIRANSTAKAVRYVVNYLQRLA